MGKHRVRNNAGILGSLGVLLGTWLGLDAILVGVARFCALRLLLRHTACLSLLLPVALRLIDRLLKGGSLILLAQVLAYGDKAGVCLELAVNVAMDRCNRTDTFLIGDLDRPHLDFTRGSLAVQGGKRRNGRHSWFMNGKERIWYFVRTK